MPDLEVSTIIYIQLALGYRIKKRKENAPSGKNKKKKKNKTKNNLRNIGKKLFPVVTLDRTCGSEIFRNMDLHKI